MTPHQKGVHKHLLLQFYRERQGEPFTSIDVMHLPCFVGHTPQDVYNTLRRLRRTGDLWIMRRASRGRRAANYYAPVLRG